MKRKRKSCIFDTGEYREDQRKVSKTKAKWKNVDTCKTWINKLSLEIICHIMDYLPFFDVMKLDGQNKKLNEAVTLHLRIRKSINFTENKIYGWMPSKITDKILINLLHRCRDLQYIYGLHPPVVSKRRTRGSETLSIPGVVEALTQCTHLKGIAISNIFLLEAIITYLPHVEILGTFKNRSGSFPVEDVNRIVLNDNPKITSLHLVGITLPELPSLVHLKHLQLRWVHLSDSHPFKDFSAPSLQSFVMAHCAGPVNTNSLKYVRLITSLAAARSLRKLELIRVPFLGGLIQHVVEDSWRIEGFRQVTSLKLGACKHALEMDVGFLAITANAKLEELSLQPSLTRDSLFVALKLAEVSFPYLQTLTLGFVDSFPEPGQWTNEELLAEHLSDIVEFPATLTDIGMKSVGQCFPGLHNLEIYNCPHLHIPTSWFTSGQNTWRNLKELYLRRCHAIKLEDFCEYIQQLPCLELLHLEQMFREPPKGCSRVGLSAGTGLGMSSALVAQESHGPHNAANDSDDDSAIEDEDNNNDNNVANQVIDNNNDDAVGDQNHQNDGKEETTNQNQENISADKATNEKQASKKDEQEKMEVDKSNENESFDQYGDEDIDDILMKDNDDCNDTDDDIINDNFMVSDVDEDIYSAESDSGEKDNQNIDKQDQDDPLTDKQDKDDPVTGKRDKDDPLTDKRDKDDPLTDKQDKNDPLTDKQDKDDPVTDKQDKDDSVTDKRDKDDPLTDKQDKDDPLTDKQDKDDPVTDKRDKDDTDKGTQGMDDPKSDKQDKDSKRKNDEMMEVEKIKNECNTKDENLMEVDGLKDQQLCETYQNSKEVSREEYLSQINQTMEVVSEKHDEEGFQDTASKTEMNESEQDSVSPVPDNADTSTNKQVDDNLKSIVLKANSSDGKYKENVCSSLFVKEHSDCENECCVSKICTSPSEKIVKSETVLNTSPQKVILPDKSELHNTKPRISSFENLKNPPTGTSLSACEVEPDLDTSIVNVVNDCRQSENEKDFAKDVNIKSEKSASISYVKDPTNECLVSDIPNHLTCCSEMKSDKTEIGESAAITHSQVDINSTSQEPKRIPTEGTSITEVNISLDVDSDSGVHTPSDISQCLLSGERVSQSQTDNEASVKLDNDIKTSCDTQFRVDNTKITSCKAVIQNDGNICDSKSENSSCSKQTEETKSQNLSVCISESIDQPSCSERTENSVKLDNFYTNENRNCDSDNSVDDSSISKMSKSPSHENEHTNNVGDTSHKKTERLNETDYSESEINPQDSFSANSKFCETQSAMETDCSGNNKVLPPEKNVLQSEKLSVECCEKPSETFPSSSDKLDLEPSTLSHTTASTSEIHSIVDEKTESDFIHTSSTQSNVKCETVSLHYKGETDEGTSKVNDEDGEMETILVIEIKDNPHDVVFTEKRVRKCARESKVSQFEMSGEITLRENSGEIILGPTEGKLTANVTDIVYGLSDDDDDETKFNDENDKMKKMKERMLQKMNGKDIRMTFAGDEAPQNIAKGRIVRKLNDNSWKTIIVTIEERDYDNPVPSCSGESDRTSDSQNETSESSSSQNKIKEQKTCGTNSLDNAVTESNQIVDSVAEATKSEESESGNDHHDNEMAGTSADTVSPKPQTSSKSKGKSLCGKKKGLVKKGRVKLDGQEETFQNSSNDTQHCQVNSKTVAQRQHISASGPVKDTKSESDEQADRTFNSSSIQPSNENRSTNTESSAAPGNSHPKKCDQSTSTGDSVLEEDHVQILELKSDSLVCVTLHLVGITDVVFKDCPKLTSVSGNGCRILKQVKVDSVPRLQKANFTQCKKLDEQSLLKSIICQPAQKNCIVTVRPLHQFSSSDLEKSLFSSSEADFNVCVIYDYCSKPQNTLYNRGRISTWTNLFTGINGELLQYYNFPEWNGSDAKEFPWGRSIYTMSGINDDGSSWEIVTDIPWLKPLSQCPDLSSDKLSAQDKKVGLYCPAAKGHFGVSECLLDLQDEIALQQSQGLRLFAFSLVVYVNMCDTNGTPTPDPYI